MVWLNEDFHLLFSRFLTHPVYVNWFDYTNKHIPFVLIDLTTPMLNAWLNLIGQSAEPSSVNIIN